MKKESDSRGTTVSSSKWIQLDQTSFLKLLFPELTRDEKIELRVKNRNGDIVNQSFHPSIPSFLKAAEQYKKYEVWYGVATRRGNAGTKDNCFRVRAVWADLDNNTTLDEVMNMDPMPNIVVESGGGLHPYWLLTSSVFLSDEERITTIEGINRGLKAKFGGDNAIDISRILRVPGFRNHKYDPPRTVKAHSTGMPEYTVDELKKFNKPKPPSENLDLAGGDVVDVPEHIQKMLDTVSSKPNGEDPSTKDDHICRCMAEAGIMPEDAYATFMASARGEDVLRRKPGHAEDYMRRTISKAYSEVKKKKAKPQDEDIEVVESWQWQTLSDALNNPIESPPYVVESLIVEGGLTGCSAHPRSGKSAAFLCACIEAAAGRSVWGYFPVAGPIRTAFIETEDPEWLVSKRIQDFTAGLKLNEKERRLVEKNFRFACLGPFALVDAEDRLNIFLKSPKPAFAVLSTLQGLLNGRDWAAQPDMGPVYGILLRIVHKLCPMVLITHSPWDKKIKRSAGTITQEANFTISLHFEKTDNRVAVGLNTKIGVDFNFALLIDGNLRRFRYTTAKKKDKVDVEGDMTAVEAAEEAKCSDRWVRKLRQREREKNEAKKTVPS